MKKRLLKLTALFFAALILYGSAPLTALTLPAVSAEEITAEAEAAWEEAAEPTPKATKKPKKTEAPTQEPTAAPKATKKPKKTEAPTEEPTTAPKATKKPKKTEAPTEEPTAAPKATKKPKKTEAPTQEPTAAPGTVILGYIKLIKEGVNLRETPNGKTLTPTSAEWLHRDTVLPYYKKPVSKGGYYWIYVKYKDMFGYIRSDCYDYTEGPAVTPAPTEVPKPMVTDAPTAEPAVTPKPTKKPKETGDDPDDPEEPMMTAVPVEEHEAWTVDDTDAIRFGTIEEMLALVQEKGCVYISTEEKVLVKDFRLFIMNEEKGQGIFFLPDEEVFNDEKYDYEVILSRTEEIEDRITQDDIDTAKKKTKTDIWFWVKKTKKPKVTPTPTPGPTVTPTVDPDPTKIPLPTGTIQPGAGINVKAKGEKRGEWSNKVPSYTLSGGTEGMAYAVLLFDEELTRITGSTYQETHEGIRSIRFALIDEKTGDILDISTRHTLMLDFTQPGLEAFADDEVDYRIVVYAEDQVSGVTAVSVDSGKTWQKCGNEEEFYVTFKTRTVLPAGSIMARDAAGNVTVLESKIIADRAGGGGGWGGGHVVRHTQPGDGKDKDKTDQQQRDQRQATYLGFALTLPEEEVTMLTLADETVNLYVTGEDPDGSVHLIPFAESLVRLPLREDEEPGLEANALELKLSLADETECVLHFTGEEKLRLRESRLDYLILSAGDKRLVISTDEILGGLDYEGLRREGVSETAFVYEITLGLRDEAPDGMAVSLDGQAWQLMAESTFLMHEADIYIVTEDMLSIPKALWPEEGYSDRLLYPTIDTIWRTET